MIPQSVLESRAYMGCQAGSYCRPSVIRTLYRVPQPLYNVVYADVAQPVEQHIRNVWVVCSNHIIGSRNSKASGRSGAFSFSGYSCVFELIHGVFDVCRVLVRVSRNHLQRLVATDPLDGRKIHPSLNEVGDRRMPQGMPGYSGWIPSCTRNLPRFLWLFFRFSLNKIKASK